MAEAAASFEVTPEIRHFMVAQRGDFANVASDPELWRECVSRELEETYARIRLWFKRPARILDIGSGVGAIDALLCNRMGCFATLVDGEDGNGVALKHNEPFGNRLITEKFMALNGVRDDSWEYCNPSQLLSRAALLEPYDIVLSLRSWCFHYAPSSYLRFVKRHVRLGSVIMVDVRRHYQHWQQELEEAWPKPSVLDTRDKFVRTLYVERGLA